MAPPRNIYTVDTDTDTERWLKSLIIVSLRSSLRGDWCGYTKVKEDSIFFQFRESLLISCLLVCLRELRMIIYILIAIPERHRLDTATLQWMEIGVFPEVPTDTIRFPAEVWNVSTALADCATEMRSRIRHFICRGISKRIDPNKVDKASDPTWVRQLFDCTRKPYKTVNDMQS